MSDVPDQLTLKTNRDREGRRDFIGRRIAVGVLVVVVGLGFVNLFGQHPSTHRADNDAAALEVYAPERVRGGLFYEARFTIEARRDLEEAMLVLDPGWVEGITINTVEPGPVGEASRNGDLVFQLGRVPARQKHVFYLQLQVNPTNIGHRSQNVRLFDGSDLLATVERSITVFP